MEKYLNAITLTGGIAVGAISAWFNDIWLLLFFVIVFLLMDYATGILAAMRNGEVSSSKATRGIYKKAGFIFLVAMGFALDAVISWFIENGLEFTLPFTLPFGLIMCGWVIFSEAISVTENLHKMGVTVPERLLQFLKIAKDKTGEEGKSK